MGDTTRSLISQCSTKHTLCMAAGKKTPEGMTAGARIKACREGKGFTLKDLSKLISGALTGPGIGNYEQGTRKLNIRIARLLGRALEAHPAYLMGLLTEEEHRFLQALKAQAGPLPKVRTEEERAKPSRSSRSATY